jgi:Caspase domain
MNLSALVLSILIAGGGVEDRSPTRRAVVIGINAYADTTPRHIKALQGAVPDAKNVAELLKTTYRFENVQLLLDGQATREAIFAGIRELAKDARPGDVRVFYFSGHGARVQNDQSPEADKLDEAIVPFDAPAGALDLRDKELAREFNAVIDKGAVLTVLLDSCHSGSAVRGQGKVPPGAVARLAPMDSRVLSDPSRPVPPELRGALILSAAQDIEYALEFSTPSPHGAFTAALLESLKDKDTTTEPAQRLFQRALQRLHQMDTPQTPVLAGTIQRQRATVFDAAPAVITAKVEVAVNVTGGRLVVDAGPALGLGAGSVLGKPDGKGGYAVKLKVTELEGPARALAMVSEGDSAAVGSGGLFEVVEWSAVPAKNLQIDLGAGVEASVLTTCQNDLQTLKTKRGVQLVSDPVRRTHWLEWEATTDGPAWVLYGAKEAPKRLTSKQLRAWKPAGAPVAIYAVLPAPKALVDTLKTPWSRPGGLVAAGSRAEAHYRLLGQLGATGPEYSLVREPKFAVGPLAVMPEHTDAVTIAVAQGGAASAATVLQEAGARLSRIYGWLLLKSPDRSDAKFPYQLVLRRADGKLRGAGEVVSGGETYGLALRADSPAPDVQPRWVYVFAMDKNGTRQLLFPQGQSGDVENRVPRGTGQPEREVVLAEKLFDVSPPFGTDTYFLLATDSKLPDLGVLSEEGVATRGLRGPDGDSLPDDLLAPVTQRTRGVRLQPQPTDWTVRKIALRSAP